MTPASMRLRSSAGHFTLKLETREITNDQRPAATGRAAQLISGLI